MAGDGLVESRPTRFANALLGKDVHPRVVGISFVEPRLLADSGEVDDDPGSALAASAVRAGLDFVFVPSWETWAAGALEALARAGVGRAWAVPGVLWPALEAVGVSSGLRAAATGPHGLDGPMEEALAQALRAARRGVDGGADAIVVADDLAGSSGPLVDPAFLRAAVFPRLSSVAAVAREAGLPAVLHCDGDARSLMTIAATAGFSAIHGDAGGARYFEDALATARSAGLVTIGGISAAALRDSMDAMRAADRARWLASGGGLLVCDDGGASTRSEVTALLEGLAAIRRP